MARSPAVEDGGDANPGAKMLRIGSDRQQGLGRSFEQEIIDRRFVLIGDVSDRCRQGEDQMEVRHW